MRDSKDRDLLTLKLVGSKLDTENMRASEALNIAMSLFRNIERADKNISLNNIKSGCIECTGNIAVEYINTPSALKDIILDFLEKNAKVEYVDMIKTSTNKKIYTVRPESKEELFFNVVDFFEGEVIDIGGRDPNIHIIIDGKVRVFSIPEKERSNPYETSLPPLPHTGGPPAGSLAGRLRGRRGFPCRFQQRGRSRPEPEHSGRNSLLPA